MHYAQEVKERWGDTPAYKESQKRYATYTKEHLQEIQIEQASLYLELAALLHLDVSDPLVQANIKAQQSFISKYWYECTNTIFESLGLMYISDERFTHTIDTMACKEGTTLFLSNAIAYYCSHK